MHKNTTDFLLASAFISLAVRSIADDIDEYVLGQMQKNHIPGLSLAVVKNGEITKTKGYASPILS